jgi:hypothetical protein
VKKLPQRVARLTPSITAGLILFTVGLTALLAYRAFDASRAQQQMTTNTLRDYAGFAAFQLKRATYARIGEQHRVATDAVLRWMRFGSPMPPVTLSVDSIKAVIDMRRSSCRCLEGVAFYYQVTFADRRIESTAPELATT